MEEKKYKFNNMPVPFHYSIEYKNMVLGDYFVIDSSIITDFLNDYIVQKARLSGKILGIEFCYIDGIKHCMYICINDACDNLMTFEEKILKILKVNNGHLLKSILQKKYGGGFDNDKYNKMISDGLIIEELENNGRQGRPVKHCYVSDYNNHSMNNSVDYPDYEDCVNLGVDNDEKEFIFNPNLTDDEFSKLSFDERTQWQLMNAQYKGK